MTGSARLGLGLLAVLTSLTASEAVRAEVRLQARGPSTEVLVRPADAGPWTPLGSLDPSLLNPEGDLLGDGAPVALSGGERAQVAWWRPLTARMQLAEWTGSSWAVVAGWDTRERVGTPRLHSIGAAGDALVAWQEFDEGPTTVIARRSAATPLRLPGESLIAVAVNGSRLEVLTLSESGELLLSTGGLPDIPGPIGDFERVRLTVSGGSVAGGLAASLLELSPTLTVLAPGHSLVTWWEGERLLSFALLGPDGLGPVSSLAHPGRGVVRPKQLLKEARALALAEVD